MMIMHNNRRMVSLNQSSVGYVSIYLQILDQSRRYWQMKEAKIHGRYKCLWIYESVIKGTK